MSAKAESRINVYPDSEEITLHPYQTAIFQSKARYLALIAGTGGGKTFMGPIWLTEEIRKNPQGEYMVVAPTYKMLNRKSLPALMEYFDKVGVDYDFKKQDAEICLGTGGKIFLGSADNPFSLESVQCHAIWVDEAGQLKKWAWIVLQARIGFHLGRMLMTTTPYAQNWLYKDIYKLWENGDGDYFVVQFPSIANPYYPKEEYARAKATLDPDTFDMRYKGLFKKRTGLVYKEFTEDMVVKPFPIPPEWTIFAGIDWGYNHPFAFSQFAKIPKQNELEKKDEKEKEKKKGPDGAVWNFAEYYMPCKTIEEHALQIKLMVGDRPQIAYYDPSNPQAAEDLKEALYRLGCFVLTLKPGDRDVMAGIRFVKSLMIQGKYSVFDNCKQNIEEKGLYSWMTNPAGGDYIDRVRKEDDDVQDAERYALYTSRQTSLQFY